MNSLNIYFYNITVKIYPKKFFFEKKFLKNWPKNFQKFHVLWPPKKVKFEPKKLSKKYFFSIIFKYKLMRTKKKNGIFFFGPLAIMVVFKNIVL